MVDVNHDGTSRNVLQQAVLENGTPLLDRIIRRCCKVCRHQLFEQYQLRGVRSQVKAANPESMAPMYPSIDLHIGNSFHHVPLVVTNYITTPKIDGAPKWDNDFGNYPYGGLSQCWSLLGYP